MKKVTFLLGVLIPLGIVLYAQAKNRNTSQIISIVLLVNAAHSERIDCFLLLTDREGAFVAMREKYFARKIMLDVDQTKSKYVPKINCQKQTKQQELTISRLAYHRLLLTKLVFLVFSSKVK